MALPYGWEHGTRPPPVETLWGKFFGSFFQKRTALAF
jgi:hypothetical protein